MHCDHRAVWAICAVTSLLAAASTATAGPNSAMVTMTRVDDCLATGNQYMVGIDLTLGVAGIDNVHVVTGGGVFMQLVGEPGGRWFYELGLPDIDAVHDQLDGTWWITVLGKSSSQTTFTFSAGKLDAAGSFFAPATGLIPASGSSVDPGVEFSWVDPTNGQADALVVAVEDDNDVTAKQAGTVFGTLGLGDTTWDPPLDLAPGSTKFEVLYVRHDSSLVGEFTVFNGDIVWQPDAFAPGGYPASKPLLVVGSESVTCFDVKPVVNDPCPGDVTGDKMVNVQDVIRVILNWGPCDGECPLDRNHDQQIDVQDLVFVILRWGVCGG